MFGGTSGTYRAFHHTCAPATVTATVAGIGGRVRMTDDGGCYMRIIADAAGVVWTIFEVKKQGGPAEQWTYLPEQFGNGWLCFESSVSKRRLTPVPRLWLEYTDKELVRLLDAAEPVVRPRLNAEEETRPE